MYSTWWRINFLDSKFPIFGLMEFLIYVYVKNIIKCQNEIRSKQDLDECYLFNYF